MSSVSIARPRRSSQILQRVRFDATEVAWLAGILEGEGSFLRYRSIVKGKVYLYPRIVLGMTDRDVVQKVADMFGVSLGKVKNARGRRPMYRAIIQGERAVGFMRALLPYMGKRRTRRMIALIREHKSKPDPNIARRKSGKETAAKKQRSTAGTFVKKEATR